MAKDTRLDQTADSFASKWNTFSDSFLETTVDPGSEIFNWIITRNGLNNVDDLASWLGNRTRILDAGCGNGRVTALLANHARKDSQILGIDLVGAEVAARNLVKYENVRTEQADLMQDLTRLGKFDLIYCQEVLHHTENPKLSFENLVNILEKGGEIAIYVYKVKAPLREYADDFVRDQIESLSLEQSREAIQQITDFAQTLSRSNLAITVPGVNVLGIKEGTFPLQRFMYNNFFKNFWNNELSYDENFAVNFDWYHPSLCSRHTLKEVLDWFAESKLEVIHYCEDDYGITIRGIKPL